jgi:hypothetical protein
MSHYPLKNDVRKCDSVTSHIAKLIFKVYMIDTL